MSDYVYNVTATARDRYNSTKSANFSINSTTRIKDLIVIMLEDVDGYAPTEDALNDITNHLLIHRSYTYNSVELEMDVI